MPTKIAKALLTSKIDLSRIRGVTPVPAVYQAHTRKAFAGNPLIEAILPPAENEVQTARRMFQPIDYDREKVRSMSKRQRLDSISELDDLYIPTAWHVEHEQQLTDILLKGLRARNPLSADGSALHYQAGDKPSPWVDPGQRPEGSIVLIDGLSGMGKTSFVKGVARCWGKVPVISHTGYNGNYIQETQIIYLKVNCPEDRSLKSLAANLLFSVVQMLGPDKELFNILLNQQVTRKVLVSVLRYLIAEYHIGMLIIDEIRNLFLDQKLGTIDPTPKESEIVAFLLNLRDEVKVPIALIGTPEVADFLDTSLSMNRRLARDGIFSLRPPLSADDPEWQSLCGKIWKYQWTQECCILDDEVKEVLFTLTAGITGVLVALFQQAQRLALNSNQTSISAELLTDTLNLKFSRLIPILNGIKDNDPLAKLRWADIWVPRENQ